MRRTVMALLLSLALLCGVGMVPPKADAYYGRVYTHNCYVGYYCDVAINVPAQTTAIIQTTDVYCDGYGCWNGARVQSAWCNQQWWWQTCDIILVFGPISGYVNYVEIATGANQINYTWGYP